MLVKHSASRYAKYICRCPLCKAAYIQARREAASKRAERLARGDADVPHGRPSTYTNWGCRCDACKAAATSAVQKRKARRRSRVEQARIDVA